MLENLNLTRPLAVFDIESTGVVPQRDRIVEIAVMKIMPDGTSRTTVRRLNPGMPIPPGATAIHGITDADVADCPQFADIAEKLLSYLEDCDLAGYNIQGLMCRCWNMSSKESVLICKLPPARSWMLTIFSANFIPVL